MCGSGGVGGRGISISSSGEE